MFNKQILIVEDEMLIAESYKRVLSKYGYTKIAVEISVEKALKYLETTTVDLVLLDINLYGRKSGLDLGDVLSKTYKLPFIYITSYEDSITIAGIKGTKPDGYLHKPVTDIMLTTTIDLVLEKQIERGSSVEEEIINFTVKSTTYKIPCGDLLYAKASHVYVELHLKDDKELLRISLRDFMKKIPDHCLVQINRSIAINPAHIQKYNKRSLQIDNLELSISPKYQENLRKYV